MFAAWWTNPTDLKDSRVSDIHVTKGLEQKRPWNFSWIQIQYEPNMFYKLSKSRGDLNGVGKSTVFVKKKKKSRSMVPRSDHICSIIAISCHHAIRRRFQKLKCLETMSNEQG